MVSAELGTPSSWLARETCMALVIWPNAVASGRGVEASLLMAQREMSVASRCVVLK